MGRRILRTFCAPLPHLKLTPTGGVDVKNAGEWIKAGAVFVGAGSALVSKDAMTSGDWATIEKNAKAFVDVIRVGSGKIAASAGGEFALSGPPAMLK